MFVDRSTHCSISNDVERINAIIQAAKQFNNDSLEIQSSKIFAVQIQGFINTSMLLKLTIR